MSAIACLEIADVFLSNFDGHNTVDLRRFLGPTLLAFHSAVLTAGLTWSLLILGVTALVIFSGVAIYYISTLKMRRQLLLLQQQRTSDELRQQISRDIHDDVGANLSKLMMYLSQMEQNGDVAPHAIGKLKMLAGEAMEGLSEIVWSVNAEYDPLANLVAWLRNYAYDYFEGTDVELFFAADAVKPFIKVNPNNRRQLLLLFKEVLGNIARHASAKRVEINMEIDENDHFQLSIRDDGKGFLPSGKRTRNGLTNMKLRAQKMNWTVAITSAPEQGTLVVFSGKIR